MGDEEQIVERVQQEERVEPAPGQGVQSEALAAFESARAALVAERRTLVEQRRHIDQQIARIDAVISPAKRQEPVLANAIVGSGSTAAIRRFFAERNGGVVTAAEVSELIGSRSRASSLLQSMERSGQIRRISPGRFRAMPKLAELAKGDG